MDMLYIRNLGRGKINLDIPLKDGLDDQSLVNLVGRTAKKHLISSCIEVVYDQIKMDGVIIAGFHSVGEFSKALNIAVKQKEIEEVKVIKITPSKDFGSSGYISPDGEYFKCEYQEHNSLYDRLKESGYEFNKDFSDDYGSAIATKSGWIHLSGHALMFYNKLTQKQIDFVFDYMKFFKFDTIKCNGNSKTMDQIIENYSKV